MLLDSNIIIYSFQPKYQYLQKILTGHDACCSSVSQIETLGYHKLSEQEKFYLQRCFETIEVFPITRAVVTSAVFLRQQKSLSLGDAIIAATALENEQTLVTRNVKDFEWIGGLKVVDPFEDAVRLIGD